jgi:hypothetical protein
MLPDVRLLARAARKNFRVSPCSAGKIPADYAVLPRDRSSNPSSAAIRSAYLAGLDRQGTSLQTSENSVNPLCLLPPTTDQDGSGQRLTAEAHLDELGVAPLSEAVGDVLFPIAPVRALLTRPAEGATLQLPNWEGSDVGWAPFP